MKQAGPTEDSSAAFPSGSPAPAVLFDAAGDALDRLVRVQQDFPQPGVLFRDLTPVLADASALRDVARALAAAAPDATLIAGLESRGFLLGAAAAMIAEIGVLAIRKPGKLPGAVLGEDYALEYGTARLELHPDDVPSGSRVLVIDGRAGHRRHRRSRLPAAAARGCSHRRGGRGGGTDRPGRQVGAARDPGHRTAAVVIPQSAGSGRTADDLAGCSGPIIRSEP